MLWVLVGGGVPLLPTGKGWVGETEAQRGVTRARSWGGGHTTHTAGGQILPGEELLGGGGVCRVLPAHICL